MRKILFFFAVFSSNLLKGEEFEPFTVRVAQKISPVFIDADIDSTKIRKAEKNTFLLVTGEKGDFWQVRPSEAIPYYVYRAYILDGSVEASSADVHLFPSADAPIVYSLKVGDKIEGFIDQKNPKWYQITPPKGIKCYVQKKTVTYFGSEELFFKVHEDRKKAEDLLDGIYLSMQEKIDTSTTEKNSFPIKEAFKEFLQTYEEFPKLQEKARIYIDLLQKKCRQKKRSCRKKTLERRKNQAKGPLHLTEKGREIDPSRSEQELWKDLEEALFFTWKETHKDKGRKEYLEMLKLHGIWKEGSIDSYEENLHHKPGNFLLKKDHHPIAFLYSDKIDLSAYQGRPVRLLLSPRENNYFAFPAYCVLEVH